MDIKERGRKSLHGRELLRGVSIRGVECVYIYSPKLRQNTKLPVIHYTDSSSFVSGSQLFLVLLN